LPVSAADLDARGIALATAETMLLTRADKLEEDELKPKNFDIQFNEDTRTFHVRTRAQLQMGASVDGLVLFGRNKQLTRQVVSGEWCREGNVFVNCTWCRPRKAISNLNQQALTLCRSSATKTYSGTGHRLCCPCLSLRLQLFAGPPRCVDRVCVCTCQGQSNQQGNKAMSERMSNVRMCECGVFVCLWLGQPPQPPAFACLRGFMVVLTAKLQRVD
jgi:hypothetical protein